jgi:hypothetical protein
VIFSVIAYGNTNDDIEIFFVTHKIFAMSTSDKYDTKTLTKFLRKNIEVKKNILKFFARNNRSYLFLKQQKKRFKVTLKNNYYIVDYFDSICYSLFVIITEMFFSVK